MKIRQKFLNAATAAVLATYWMSAAAQDENISPELSADDQPRRYTVEVLIFRYVEDVATGSEQFYADSPDPEEDQDNFAAVPELIDELSVTPAERRIDLGPFYGEPPKFVLLSEDEYTMTGILDRFDRLDVYETIMHFGWTQLTYPEEPTEPVELRVFGDPPVGLDGNLTLYLTRYLHLVVDLRLAADNDPGIDAASYGRSDTTLRLSRFGFGDSVAENRRPVYYRISENRIVRNGDLRYFDHPKFGVIAKVTRVEEEIEDDVSLPGIAIE